MAISVHVKLQATPGNGDKLVAAFEELFQGPLDDEAGTVAYVISQAKDDPDLILFYELYADEAALQAHMGGKLREVFPKLAGLVAGQSEMTQSIPKHAKGLAI